MFTTTRTSSVKSQALFHSPFAHPYIIMNKLKPNIGGPTITMNVFNPDAPLSPLAPFTRSGGRVKGVGEGAVERLLLLILLGGLEGLLLFVFPPLTFLPLPYIDGLTMTPTETRSGLIAQIPTVSQPF